MSACPICDGSCTRSPGGVLSCPTLNRLQIRAMDLEAPPRVPADEETPFYLARVLAMHSAPGHLVSLAREGHYDDYRSPLALPEIQLVRDALAADLEDVAALAVLGAFDATKAESDAWAASPDGQATFTELLHGGARQGGKNRAARRRRGRS